MDSVPNRRKINRYCQCIGMSNLFEHDDPIDPERLVTRLGRYKYYSINTYHLFGGHRPTIEFRIAEEEVCKNPKMALNWTRLILHFVEMTMASQMPNNLTWYDPIDVMRLLGFMDRELSPELVETRNWFLARLYLNNRDSGRSLVTSNEARRHSIRQVNEILEMLRIKPEELENFCYGSKTI